VEFAALAPFLPELVKFAEMKVQVSFREKTFAEIRAAAKQTQLPIPSYLQQVVEADLASRRMAPGANNADSTDHSRRES
jgi:hypothetical protein